MTDATALLEDGVVVLPLLGQAEVDLFRRALQECQQQFPEFETPAEMPLVMGAFGAYANPSSFHNPFIRTLRMRTAAPMIRFFAEVCSQRRDPTGWRLEMLFDRTCVRRRGTVIAGETWHRDLNPAIMVPDADDPEIFRPRSDDEVYGGFLNLDEAGRSQLFECIPGSHLDEITARRANGTESGFHAEVLPRDRTSRVYEIPPGHLIIFRQCILHNVMPRRLSADSYRQFRCWRLVRHEQRPLQDMLPGIHKTLEETIREQGVPRLPSGQIPPLYSANHGSLFLWREDERSPRRFAAKVVPVCRKTKRAGRTSKYPGASYTVPHRFMRSLQEYGLPMYPPYTAAEQSLMRPNHQWQLPIFPVFSSVDDILNMSGILDVPETEMYAL